MAVNSRTSTELLIPKKWKERSEISPERTKICSRPKLHDSTSIIDGPVAVVYYLCRNGHLEHPHFIEVPLSSSHGLYLRDVMNRLNSLRGNGMPYMYSWSSKRSYKNGYVWQDLSESDLIQPTDGHDYILKGSELLSFRSQRENLLNDTSDSSMKSRRKKHQSWSSFEDSTDYQNEYRVYKCKSSRELGRKSADMATQTEEKRRQSRSLREEYGSKTEELSREELSPPPSMSSSERLEGGTGSGDVDRCGSCVDRMAENECTSGTTKASRVLMQLITCGSSVAVKNYGSTKNKSKPQGFPTRLNSANRVIRDSEEPQ